MYKYEPVVSWDFIVTPDRKMVLTIRTDGKYPRAERWASYNRTAKGSWLNNLFKE